MSAGDFSSEFLETTQNIGVPAPKRLKSPFQEFVHSESFGGVLLVAVAFVAFAWANSPWKDAYFAMLNAEVGLFVGHFGLAKHALHWVNDGLMAVFFLLVGLEIKRELKVGELSDRRAAMLPIFAAIGGMVVPAAIYWIFNRGGVGSPGWGIPMATDIAFALGIMALLGPRVPITLKIFLTALAIVDDLGAVLVIAVFYTEGLKIKMLVAALLVWVVAMAYSKLGGHKLRVFALLGIAMWFLMLKSGVHATVAGVLLAFTVPMRRQLNLSELKLQLTAMFQDPNFEQEEVELEHLEGLINRTQSPLHELEHSLQPWVAFFIMPVFALFNAGLPITAEASLSAPIPMGSFLGLLVGKPIGILFFVWIAIATGIAASPPVSRLALIGTSILGGIGFTMSLFIASLAFGEGQLLNEAKLGVLTASVLAALLGLGFLYLGLRKQAHHPS